MTRRIAMMAAIAILSAACSGGESEMPEPSQTMIPVTGGELNSIRSADSCDTQPSPGPTVLFLHGASFRATTWADTGTHRLLCTEGIPGMSVDLPGFGDSTRFDHDAVRLLDDVVAHIGTDVIVVSPSMSGTYSLPWLATNPESAAGFVPVAPVATGSWRTPPGFSVPTLGIWGSEDTIVPVQTGRTLIESIAGASLRVIDGGGHAVYMTNPDEFHEALLEFVMSLR